MNVQPDKKVKIINQQQKYRIAFTKCKEFVSLTAEVTEQDFGKRNRSSGFP